MACIHNQSKIDSLNKQIQTKKKQIAGLNSNITACKEIKNKHENFNKKIGCVITNLADIAVVPGEAYDKGKMTECLTNSNATISDCDDVISLSESRITLLESEIVSLQSQISLLQGDCSSCQVSLLPTEKL